MVCAFKSRWRVLLSRGAFGAELWAQSVTALRVHSTPINASVGDSVPLQAWIEHPEEEVWIGWAHHSGAGNVEFDKKEYEILTNNGQAVVQAKFDQPGQYIVRMQTIDDIAAFEFYCCHTNAYFHINVSN